MKNITICVLGLLLVGCESYKEATLVLWDPASTEYELAFNQDLIGKYVRTKNISEKAVQSYHEESVNNLLKHSDKLCGCEVVKGSFGSTGSANQVFATILCDENLDLKKSDVEIFSATGDRILYYEYKFELSQSRCK